MSIITDVMLFPGGNRFMKDLPGYLSSFGAGAMFPPSPTAFRDLPTSKVFTMDPLLGSFNHLNIDGFIAHLRAFGWTYPSDWVLVVEFEMDRSVGVYWQDGGRPGEPEEW